MGSCPHDPSVSVQWIEPSRVVVENFALRCCAELRMIDDRFRGAGKGAVDEAQFWEAIKHADADSKTARSGPRLAFDDRAQLAVAAVAALRRLALIVVRQPFFPIDVIFFEVTVGIDGRAALGR